MSSLTQVRKAAHAAPPQLSGLANAHGAAPHLPGPLKHHGLEDLVHRVAVFGAGLHSAMHRALDPHLAKAATDARGLLAKAAALLPNAGPARPQLVHDLALTPEQLQTLCETLCALVLLLDSRSSALLEGAAAVRTAPVGQLQERLQALDSALHEAEEIVDRMDRDLAGVASAAHGRVEQLSPGTADALDRSKAHYLSTALPHFAAAQAACEDARALGEARLRASQPSLLVRAVQPIAALVAGAGGRAKEAQGSAAAAAATAATAAPAQQLSQSSGPVDYTQQDKEREEAREAEEIALGAVALNVQMKVLTGEVLKQEKRVGHAEAAVDGSSQSVQSGLEDVGKANRMVNTMRTRMLIATGSSLVALAVTLLVLGLKYGMLGR
jgi:hypothetical protein